nr:MAG TPA: hypothetical protein [Caudoviricetes sp.]
MILAYHSYKRNYHIKSFYVLNYITIDTFKANYN